MIGYIDKSVPNVERIRAPEACREGVLSPEALQKLIDESEGPLIGDGTGFTFAARGNVVEFPTGKPIDPAPSAELVPVEITCFVKESGLLTKKIRLAADATTVIDSSECRMSRGTMERVFFSDWRQLATGLGNLTSKMRRRCASCFRR